MSSQARAPVRKVATRATGGPMLQRTPTGPAMAPAALPLVHEVLHSAGEPLDRATHAAMALRFGQDFSHVRLHTDERAARSAGAVGARAYTVGRHIVFGSGSYAPDTGHGGRLLAHELTHTLQQAGDGEVGATETIVDGDPMSGHEVEAARTAADVMAGKPARPGGPLAALAAPTLQRQPPAAGPTQPPSRPQTVELEFSAFIPGSAGRPLKDYPHPKDLKNQAAFDATVAAVPGTWLKEPGDIVSKNWYFATDNREFGGGSHRLGFKGSVNSAAMGRLGAGTIFTHWADPSSRVAAVHTGLFTSKGEVGSLDGPNWKTATVKSSEEPPSNAADRSTVSTKASAAYAFLSTLAPDIDYRVSWTLRRASGNQVLVSLDGQHNLFPFYEAIVNRRLVYTYSAVDTGPGLLNLNRSKPFSVSERPV